MNLGVMVIIRDMMIISMTDFSDHMYNHKYNHIAACPTTPATSTSAARPVVQKTATAQRMCLMIIQVLAADHLDDHRYIDNHKTGVEVVGRFAAQGVDEETLKALVFIHGAAQVHIRLNIC